MKPEDVTQELFDDMLFKVIDEENASALLSIPGVYELVSEEYNNEVLKRLEDAPAVAAQDDKGRKSQTAWT